MAMFRAKWLRKVVMEHPNEMEVSVCVFECFMFVSRVMYTACSYVELFMLFVYLVSFVSLQTVTLFTQTVNKHSALHTFCGVSTTFTYTVRFFPISDVDLFCQTPILDVKLPQMVPLGQ